MHELSLAESIIEVVEKTARHEGAARVKEVVLEIGELAAIDIESLKFCFDIVSKESFAAGALLKILSVPGSAWCMVCSKTVLIPERYAACPECGGYQLQITDGTAMRVKEVEIEHRALL